VLDDISPLRQATAAAAGRDLLFRPAAAIRARQSTWAETPIPPDEPLAENPPSGAVLDYYLARPAPGAVSIEILDASGRVIRKFTSDDPPEVTADELQKQLIPPYWGRPHRNPETSAGMHRFVWDLTCERPVSVTHEYPITAVPGDTPRHPLGPLAVPGRYTVRLTAGGPSHMAPLLVKIDPRVKTSQADLQQTFALQQRLASLVDRSSRAMLQATSLREQSARLGPKEDLAGAIQAFEAKVSAVVDGAEAPPAGAPRTIALSSVNDDAYSVYGMVSQVDAAPTAAQAGATRKIEADIAPALAAWETILKTDLPALNARLKQAGLPALDPGQRPRDGERQGNAE
jgi:hypothetical protein